jgi:hypothetical protein
LRVFFCCWFFHSTNVELCLDYTPLYAFPSTKAKWHLLALLCY